MKNRVVRKFRIVGLHKKSWYIQVRLWEKMPKAVPEGVWAGFKVNAKSVNVYGQCMGYLSGPRVVIIDLWAKARKLDLIAMHESVHAAFRMADLLHWGGTEKEICAREEFIVQTAECIYEKMRKKLAIR